MLGTLSLTWGPPQAQGRGLTHGTLSSLSHAWASGNLETEQVTVTQTGLRSQPGVSPAREPLPSPANGRDFPSKRRLFRQVFGRVGYVRAKHPSSQLQI